MTSSVQAVNVALLGARMHYAVPRILYGAGLLERLFTDLCASRGWPRLLRLIPSQLQPAAIKRICARVPASVPASRIVAFNSFGLEYARRRARANGPSAMTATFLWANRRFCELVCASDWGRASSVFTFNCAGLEILQRAKGAGLGTVMEQTIAPSALEQRLLREERELHPGWEQSPVDTFATKYSQREQSEWPLADLIVCGSEFVRDGIRQCGGPVEKCVVVPYGVDLAHQPSTLDSQLSTSGGRPLRVLTDGVVGLRKGAPYVLEAAQKLKGKAAFRWVGAVNLLPQAASAMREHIELTGAVPRSEMAAQYEWADAFLLPSICEGSATATYEALALGLPVVCTPNTGSVVRDGKDGFIVPIRDAGAIAERLSRLADEPALREEFSCNAHVRSQQFTVAAYGEALLKTLEGAGIAPR